MGGRAVAFATGARYCFSVGPSSEEVEPVPLVKALCKGAASKAVPEIAAESTGDQLKNDFFLGRDGNKVHGQVRRHTLPPAGAIAKRGGGSTRRRYMDTWRQN
jgi:hypothetical protein